MSVPEFDDPAVVPCPSQETAQPTPVDVPQPIVLGELEHASAAAPADCDSDPESIDVLAEFGRCSDVDRLADLHAGSVVRLDESMDAPVGVVANGVLIARGVLVEDCGRLGVRVMELVPEALAQLGPV